MLSELLPPPINWVDGFSNVVTNSSTHSEDKQIIASFDTEFTKNDKNNNICLSYQLVVINLSTGEQGQEIYYPDYTNKERLSFKEILLLIFKILNISDDQIDGYYVLLVCHFCSAEWSMMRDREKIARYFEFLYKTLITFQSQTIYFTTKDGVEHYIQFDLGDTILLLPPSHRSLEKASSLLDEEYHKKGLSLEEKSNMLHLLLTDKVRFEEYAIHDALITMMLYIKLQFLLNTICGTTNIRYSTIGSATVKQIKRVIDKKTFKSQFSKNNTLYQKGVSLAQRAYMGGLNNSYLVGEVKGKLILDIDFSSAYPTVMSLLEVSNFGKKIKKDSKKKTKF